MQIDDFKKMVFIGAGNNAEYIFAQTEDAESKLAAVGDTLSDSNRKIKEFKGRKVVNLSEMSAYFGDKDTAVVVTIGNTVSDPVRALLKEYPIEKTSLFVLNPYTSLRTFCRCAEFMNDTRRPLTDETKNKLREWFSDDISQKHLDELLTAIPWDKHGDTIELKYYPDIEPMYYLEEDYWKTYDFAGKSSDDKATVLDCGAYIGDSVRPICEAIPQKDVLYYAFEPLPENIGDMYKDEFIKAMPADKFKVMQCGVGGKNEICSFCLENEREGGRFIEGNSAPKGTINHLEIKRIDDLDLEIQGQLYIKMDIEGSELGALKGAENTIKKHRPFLAICLYHKKNDLAEIPAYIMSILDNYNLYLRGGYHTILWAIPAEKDNR